MRLSKKQLKEISIDNLLEIFENQVAYYTRTGSKLRQDNIERCEEEIKRRIKEGVGQYDTTTTSSLPNL